MNENPVVMITFIEGGENGGPYISHKRIMESELNIKYDFVPLIMPKGRLGLLNLKVINQLRKDILKCKPDIVHIGGLQLAGFHFALACKLAKVSNTIVAVHGSSSEALYFSNLKKRILNMLEAITLRITSASYGVSEYVANWNIIYRNSKKRYGCIYNLPPLLVEDNKSILSIREELGIDEDEIVITSTGRITQEKGFDILAETIRKLHSTKKIRYIIVGNGEYFKTMQEELSKEIEAKTVFLLGYRNDIDRILSGSDIFVLCTLHETLSISLLEAAKHGLPLVATDVGGIPEIVKHEFNGLLTEKDSSNSVGIALNDLIEDEEKRRRLGVNAMKHIEDLFSSEDILGRIHNMYRGIINE